MDVSTLFTAPATAASTAALSFGAMGGATAPGEAGEGLDSFNQLLGNFLALTGGMAPEGATATDGLMPVATDGAANPSLPQGTTGLFQGLNLTTAMAGTGLQGGKALEGRWAQSGLNLLAGSALAGQELNQEVVAFLNDLSTAITAEGAPMEGETSLDLAVESASEDEAEAATLLLAEGEAPAQPLPILNAALSVVITPSVIPRDTVQQTPGSLGMTLTVAGTGLQALPSVPASEETTAPAAAPIIPRLATAPVAPKAAFMAAAPTAPVAPGPVPVATTAEAAATVEAAEPLVAAPVVPSADTPAAAAVPPIATATNVAIPAAKPVVDQRVAAIALPAELAATAQTDETPIPAAMVAKLAEAAKPAENTAPVVTPVAQSAARPAAAPIAQPLPATPVTDTPAPATLVMTAEVTAQTEAKAAAVMAVDADEAVSATPVAPTPAAASTTNAAPQPQAQPVAAPAPRLEAAKANPVELAALPAEPVADAPVETPDMATDEPATQTAFQAATAAPTTGPARPAAAPVRPAATSPAHVQAAAGQPAPEAEADLADTPVQEEEATNNRMLAPRHVGAEAQTEMQDGIAGQAQSAGQNQTGIRDTAPPTVNGEREDNLLARAVTAAGKGSESKTAGDENAASNPDTGTPADTVDGVTGSAQTGEPGKAQGTDFTQSLRQTNAPHRPGAYMPPTQQMAFHVQRAVQDGNDRLSIRLNPQELGRIDVQLEIGAEGKLRAKVMVENPQTLEMLQKDSKHLEKALQDAGLQTDQNSLSFSLQDSGDQARERQDQREQSGHGTGIASEDVEQEDPAIIAQAQIMELGRVDVRV